MLFTRIELS